jgi:type I restriction enzyme S subunit
MGGEWETTSLGDICTGIYDGPHATPPPSETGAVFLRIENITRSGRLNFSDIRRINDADLSHWTRRVTPQPDDVVFSYEANLGLFARIPPGFHGCLGRRLALMRPNPSQVDAGYLLYACLAPGFQELLRQRTVLGSTVDRISLREFPSFEIPLPPLPEQKRIAHVLGTLDDKIELSRRMNATLEGISRAIFKSWFVDFDPVRQKAAGQQPVGMDAQTAALFPDSFEDSEIGEVPKGWRVDAFANHFDSDRGLSYKGEGLREDGSGVPMHNLNSIYEGGGYKHVGIKFYAGEYRDKHLIAPGDVIVTNTEQGFDHLLIGHAAIVPACFGPTGLYSHHIYRVRCKVSSPLTPHYVVALFNDPRWHYWISGFSNGTTINMLPLDALQMPLLVVPPPRLVQVFDQLATATHKRREANLQESSRLAALRDTLLPKLLSGEVRVPEAEQAVEEAIA